METSSTNLDNTDRNGERIEPLPSHPTDSLPGDTRSSLEAAFRVFSEASEQLAFSYGKLQDTVANLTEELAVANGELRRQYVEKKNLSEHLETLVRALPAGVLVLDPTRTVETANLAALRLLGPDIPSMPWAKLVERLTPTGTAGEWEITTAGKKKRLAIASSPFSVQRSANKNGNDQMVWEMREILLIHDITESHMMRTALASQQKLAAMGEMTASLAHQLRTPLATALIYAGHLVKTGLPEETRQEFSGKLLERLRALERLMTDMLSYVRGEAIDWEEFQAKELLDEVVCAFDPQFQAESIALTCDDSLSGVRLLGNRKRLEGALANLLDNAKQACRDSGPPPDDRVHQVSLKTLLDGDSWIIEVADSGSGIDEKHIERIFDPFYTTRSQGTGLGLSIVRNVARSHGGDVEVESSPGIGTAFRIRLPIARRLSSQENL